MKIDSKDMLPVNEREFRVFGLRRSGNHAIISWIMGHFPNESVYHYNDVQKILEKRLFFCDINFPIDLFKWKNRYINPGKNKSRIVFRKRNYFQIHNQSIMVRGTDIAKKLVDESKYELDKVCKSSKVCLMQSYEDQPLDIISLINQQKIGTSKHVYNILILRDIRNMIASRLEHNNKYTKLNTDVINLWKSYAYEYLGQSELLGVNKVLIFYDLWAESGEYRRHVSSKFGLPYSDYGLKSNTRFGGGSSFKISGDNKKYNERYLKYLDDPQYKCFMDNEELVYLNDSVRMCAENSP